MSTARRLHAPLMNDAIEVKSPGSCRKLRVAAFGFRAIPPKEGSAGADHVATELFLRIAARGHHVLCYNRIYDRSEKVITEYRGIRIVNLRTMNRPGLDSLVHSLKCTFHIILFNTADVVMIGNGGNSPFAWPLRLFGKRVIVAQDGIDWRREKWPWYGKLYLYLASYITSAAPNHVVFDNVYAKEEFEKRFKKQFSYIPYGSEVEPFGDSSDIMSRLQLKVGEYILFVGRFIPDKGVHYLIDAFQRVETRKKLVLVGGAPHASEYEKSLHGVKDDRICFPGYIYGVDTATLIRGAYLYVQPSEIEGLSPVILSVMGFGTPLLCSDIRENLFITGDAALTFRTREPDSLAQQLRFALDNPEAIAGLAAKAQRRVLEKFSWDSVVDQYLAVFAGTAEPSTEVHRNRMQSQPEGM